mmetsp:Transcript_14724/g.24533  ORF Transcript_14724/g.24533 Transcript_14724/m.24533 type:complete len:206 (-) Transcript_14724:168-785(-)
MDLNVRMLTANANVSTKHSFGSGWLRWPFNSAPIFYWQMQLGQYYAHIFMAGNPYIWRLALICSCILLACLLGSFFISLLRNAVQLPPRQLTVETHRWICNGWLLILGHLFAWTPFAFVERVAFLYHYIPALLFSFLAVGFVFDLILPATSARHSRIWLSFRVLISLIIQLGGVGSTCYFLPIFFGWPMDQNALSLRHLRLDKFI